MKNNIAGISGLKAVFKQFNRLEKRYQGLILLLVAVILFSLYIRLVYRPQAESLRRLRSEFTSLDNQATRLKAQIPDVEKEKETLARTEEDYHALKKQLASLEARLPILGSVPQLLGEVVGQASGYKIDFVSLRSKTTEGKEEYRQLNIEIKLNADYPNFVNYLHRLENISPFLILTDIVMKKMKEGFPAESEVTLNLLTLLGERGEALARVPFVAPVTVKRNIFSFKFRPAEKVKEKEEYELSGITLRGEQSTAIINGEVYRIGDVIGNKRIKQILSSRVILIDEKRGSTILTLKWE
ncbi:type 4a pilus biogenesis protein PilO [bacterium]|nr:type 4a pilus biogenesis protein PilO [bacterium]